MANWLRGMTREKLREMGRLGEEIIMKNYTKEKVTAQYVELVDSLLK